MPDDIVNKLIDLSVVLIPAAILLGLFIFLETRTKKD